MPIKTFRGQIADAAQDTILLHTNDGSTGYRVVKFDIISSAPGTDNEEAVVKIYKVPQASIDAVVNFSDQTLLGVAFSAASANTYYSYGTPNIIFDREIFNQDIFVTYKAVLGSASMNYYIELEQVKLDLGENTVATLKDIRNVATP